jgi:aspartate oxidase
VPLGPDVAFDELPAAGMPLPETVAIGRDALQRAMTVGAGVLRHADSLAATAATVEAIAGELPEVTARPDVAELANLVEVARALLTAATLRAESRGAHTRTDHPDTEAAFRVRIVLGGTGRQS